MRAQFGLPSVYLTAHAGDDVLERARATEPYGFLVKPLNDLSVHAAIDMALARLEADRKLRESEQNYRDLVENSPDIIHAVDKDGFIIATNKKECELLGYSREELIGMPVSKLYALDKNLGTFFAKLKLDGHRDKSPGVLQTKDGRSIDVEISSTAYYDAHGNFIRSRSILRDVTERKRTEEKLRSSEQMLAAIFNASTDPIILLDANGMLLTCNDALAKELNRPLDQLRGMHILDLLPRELAEARLIKIRDVIHSSRPLHFEDYNPQNNSWSDNSLFPVFDVFDANGRAVHVVVSVRDITARKHAEENLRETIITLDQTRHELAVSNTQLQTILAAAPDTILLVDNRGRITWVNIQVETMFGYSPDELTGQSIEALMPEGRRGRHERLRDGYNQQPRIMGTGQNVMARRKDGSEFPISARLGPIGSGDDVQTIAIVRDISDLKQVEDELRLRENYQKAIVTSLDDLIFLFDETCRFINIWTNDPGRLFVPPEQFLGKTIRAALGAEFAAPFENRVQQTILTRKHPEYDYSSPDGQRWYRAKFSYAMSNGENGHYVSCLVRDITERKQANEMLRRSEAKWKSLVENAPNFIVIIDRNYCFTYLNHVQPGLKMEDFIGHNILDDIAAEDRAELRQWYENVFETGQPASRELKALVGPNQYGWYRSHVGPICEGDRVSSLLIISSDITVQKRMEEALRESEERFRAQYQYQPLAIYTWRRQDDDLVLADFNQRARNVTNGQIERVLGQKCRDFYQAQPHIAELMYRCLREQQKMDWEGEYRTLMGTTRYFKVRCVFVPPDAVTVYVEDFTDQKQAEDALRDSEERFRVITEHSADAIFIADPTGRYTYVNQAACNLLRYNPDELMQRAIPDVCPPETVSLALESFKRLLTHGHARFEIDLQRKDGSAVAIDLNGVMLPNGLAYASCRDMAERKQMEDDLRLAKEIADKANRAKSEFLANMSHELRTPLNGILGYTQIFLRNSNLPPEMRSGITTIDQCGKHLLSLINEILDLAKIEAHRMELSEAEVHLPNFLTGVAEMIRVRAQQKNISFRYETTSALPIVVRVDEKHLRQVLLNLLSNAVKFTEHGGVTLRVGYAETMDAITNTSPANLAKVSVETSDDLAPKPSQASQGFVSSPQPIRFLVSDSGSGIPADQIESIFSPFQQMAKHARTTEGTGLGLTISRELVGLLGGELQLKSVEGKGSAFWFDIPLSEVAAQTGEAAAFENQAVIGYDGPRRALLVIDDKPGNRAVLRDLLTPLDFVIIEAEDGRDGLAKAAAHQPDLILTDIVMPEMDGLEMTRWLRQSPEIAHIKTIIISAGSYPDIRRDSLAAGCDDFLAKPVEFAALLNLLAKHLNLTWLYEQTATPAADPQADWVVPPEAELNKLRAHANIGAVFDFLDELDKIEKLDERYKPYLAKLRQLGEDMELNKILEMLR